MGRNTPLSATIWGRQIGKRWPTTKSTSILIGQFEHLADFDQQSLGPERLLKKERSTSANTQPLLDRSKRVAGEVEHSAFRMQDMELLR